jgi:hypothetical protein
LEIVNVMETYEENVARSPSESWERKYGVAVIMTIVPVSVHILNMPEDIPFQGKRTAPPSMNMIHLILASEWIVVGKDASPSWSSASSAPNAVGTTG